jgi:hypothetical protein
MFLLSLFLFSPSLYSYRRFLVVASNYLPLFPYHSFFILSFASLGFSGLFPYAVVRLCFASTLVVYVIYFLFCLLDLLVLLAPRPVLFVVGA